MSDGMDATRKLIYDIGMHRGEDTEFYLSRGHRVVGVEANPTLVAGLRAKFASEIASGQLQLVDKAIAATAGHVQFAINDQFSIWGSISETFIERNAGFGTSSRYVQVESVPMDAVLQQYGVPYYMKIDIEGMDILAVKALHSVAQRPKYLSIESAVTSPNTGIKEAFDELAHLWVLGYRQFKYVDQVGLQTLKAQLSVEGTPVTWQYRQESSGPFGEESPGRWLSIGATLARMAMLSAYWHTIGQGRYSKTLPSKIGRKLYGLVNRGSHSWFDLHAKLGGTV